MFGKDLKKKLLVTGLAGILTLSTVGTALALTQEQTNEITQLHAQMFALRKQMVQKYVEFGQLTPEQGQAIEQRMDTNFKARSESGFENCLPGQNCLRNQSGNNGNGTCQGNGPFGSGNGQGRGQGRGQNATSQAWQGMGRGGW
ncbi:YckD family protein [Heliobacterium chlorum]|uniref:YckD family protein n=1 Tax=Heliobacterium chlorum TaxID=2698 RepID=A0ABR7T159_HELCL|nr:YckD family protein [Heliobacterium chlorum]MBC9784050.1 YckD family protein [Heliobacterium chlorum]